MMILKRGKKKKRLKCQKSTMKSVNVNFLVSVTIQSCQPFQKKMRSCKCLKQCSSAKKKKSAIKLTLYELKSTCFRQKLKRKRKSENTSQVNQSSSSNLSTSTTIFLKIYRTQQKSNRRRSTKNLLALLRLI